MQIKHFDKVSGKWVTDGASNAANLELTNPGFVNEAGKSISVNEGFTKLDNRVSKLEQNLAWVYLNGAKGGGGSGGTGGSGSEYTISITEGNIIYTSTSSATVNILIKSGGIKKQFTVIARDTSTNKTLGTWKIYSMTRTALEFNNLSGTNKIEIIAYDSTGKYADPGYVTIIAGAIKLEIDKIPAPTMYLEGDVVMLNFTLFNNILTSPASFELYINDVKIIEETNITTSIHTISKDARQLLFKGGYFDSPKPGQKFIFKAVAKTTLGTEVITSNVISFDITIANANKLLIVTSGITDFIPTEEDGFKIENLSTFYQGRSISFSYYLSYSPIKYQIFNIYYDVYLVKGSELSLLDTGVVTNVRKGEDNQFIYSTVNSQITGEDEYIKIVLTGKSADDENDVDGIYEKTVTCRIITAEKVDLYANNKNKQLLAYFSKVSGFPNYGTGTWTYKPTKDGKFDYTGGFVDQFPNGVNLTLYKVNGSTSGFIKDVDGVNSIPAIRLVGESHGQVEVAEYMFPKKELGAGFFRSSGFHISTTFKSDESTNTDETILSIGRYKNGLIDSGYEITLESVTVKIGNADTLVCKIPQNELLTVDLDVSLVGTGWYFKVFINGVMSAVTRVDQSKIDWFFEDDIYLGCRNENGVLNKFANVNIYDLKLYTHSQNEYSIAQNYISATEQASLIKGEIDANLDINLRSKNFINESGTCLLWDDINDKFLEGNELYTTLLTEVKNKQIPYPIVLIEETSNTHTLFEAYTTAIFDTTDKETVMNTTFPCRVLYTDSTVNSYEIRTPEGVSDDRGVRVGIQGTSSLSYNAKNLELYMGDADASGKDLLFAPKEDWLPENRFTLKADVMDSAHVNNVVIGKVVNGAIKDSSGQSISPFAPTPPMSVSNAVWGDENKANEIKNKIKHTSDGFPCLVFVQHSPDASGRVPQKRFFGIYNFNLGRHAYFNLGMKILKDYEKDPNLPEGQEPFIVTKYEEIANYWNKTTSDGQEGMYSMEINHNDSAQGAFQQDDLSIVKYMADVAYTSNNNDAAYDNAQKFYKQMASMVLTKTQKYKMNAQNNGYIPIENEFYNPLTDVYTFEECEKHLNWNNACAYYIIALIFGMVDSMCKNLTIRNWGGKVWYPAFYDMDTAFKLNNIGQDIVDYFAHLHRWYNIPSNSGITTFTIEKNYSESDEYKQHFASFWNRIWEILENLHSKDASKSEGRTTLEQKYIELRTKLFPDPDKFIDDYYKAYTDQIGSIVFNYDYNIKYLKTVKKYNADKNEYIDQTDFSQLKFLHGNRVIGVKEWFRKRIYFLDSVYGYSEIGNTTIPKNVKSPVNTLWAANKVGTVANAPNINMKMSAVSRLIQNFTIDGNRFAYWLQENPQDIVISPPGGETVAYIYANEYITEFTNFNKFKWTSLNYIDLPLLKKLDLTGLRNIPASDFFKGGVYGEVSDIIDGVTTKKVTGLKNIEELILKDVQLIFSSSQPTYTLDVENCNKLQKLDISSSSITSVSLPKSGSLKYYNLSNTTVDTLELINQSFLEEVVLDGCTNLKTVTISNCGSLKKLIVPSSVEKISISSCESLEVLKAPYNGPGSIISPLKEVAISTCIGLKEVDLSNQNNQELKISLVGAINLEYLNLSGILTSNINLPSLEGFTTLKSLNISRTNISYLTFNDFANTEFLDLSNFPDLSNITASDCPRLTRVVCQNNPDNPIELQINAFSSCSALERIEGNFSLMGFEIFKGCSRFVINSPYTYQTYGTKSYYEGTGVTNISLHSNLNTCEGMFEGCSNLSYNDFKYMMGKLTNKISSLERMFKGCYNINGELWYDLFRNSQNVSSIKEFLSGSSIGGVFYSRNQNYSYEDDSTWGILDFLPKLINSESAFSGTNISFIDNRLFAPFNKNGELIYSPIKNVNKMFSNCKMLKSADDTKADVVVEGYLSSEDFFLNLRNLLTVYPEEVFLGCSNVNMKVVNDDEGNTLLFHTLLKEPLHPKLTNSLYVGVNLIGEIKPNVFGGITREFGNYVIPKFTAINNPFSGTGSYLTIDLSKSGSIFRNISKELLQAVGVFNGLTLTGEKIIPNDIFEGCVNLNSVNSIFANLNIDNNGNVLEFPHKDLFKDCISLKNIRSILQGCNKVKIKLIGEGFRNCKLTDVSMAFKDSGIFGTIPYRLFYMFDGNNIGRTIELMDDVFSGCYYLGYDETREYDFSEIKNTNYSYNLTWHDHIVKNEGKPVNYKLDVSNIKKDIDSNAFDDWYLDGYGWEGATVEDLNDQEEFDKLKEELSLKYFVYDEKQKEVINQQQNTIKLSDTAYQNYKIPTDLFRYCNKKCTLSNVLNSLNWVQKELVIDDETNEIYIKSTEAIEGLFGRIPMRLFESLTDSTKFDSVFKNTYFCSFVGAYDTGKSDDNKILIDRGLMYPPNMFSYNEALSEVPELFAGTVVHVGSDVNSDLFGKNSNLSNVSGLFSDCEFDSRYYDNSSFPQDKSYSQINFNSLFEGKNKITDASGLFQVNNISLTKILGLRFIERGLLSSSTNITNISNMFAGNTNMSGEVPIFASSTYRFITQYSGYLSGVDKSSIINANELDDRLIPEEWKY